MNTYQKTCRNYILDTLDNYEGQKVEVSELGMLLTEGPNADGSWHCSTYKAQEELKNWFDDVAEFIEEYQGEFGTKPQHDAFTQPELFHCLMMIMGVEKMLNELDIISDLWDYNVTLDSELIKKIITELTN